MHIVKILDATNISNRVTEISVKRSCTFHQNYNQWNVHIIQPANNWINCIINATSGNHTQRTTQHCRRLLASNNEHLPRAFLTGSIWSNLLLQIEKNNLAALNESSMLHAILLLTGCILPPIFPSLITKQYPLFSQLQHVNLDNTLIQQHYPYHMTGEVLTPIRFVVLGFGMSLAGMDIILLAPTGTVKSTSTVWH